ncbi:sacsin N-terminal ATP-binding-like domain-containing protein [Flammeovirga sp. SJP92]|uniref:sacsin N-terminal ATP-binding-like domain-containing protein n=1 Tax=Flammeovirga sp. SJP92 TaxID=1775430 RepID=UPI000786DA53|nr:hypothetical protein [Flammeovirga sp. SJP92]KXX69203.1 hypothetical protein AVL50_16500 [Flammeovirga sp. SJP92]
MYKNLKTFRKWVKESDPATDNEYYNPDFIGCKHEKQRGFFALYHGIKEKERSYIRGIIEVAEDNQAIYEFVQNAADSDSTHFYMFYNEKYFLAINNGDIFKKEGLKSIINVGQTTDDKETDPDKIGRFGMGFKLTHRLVGKNSGLDELFNDYKGPQMFSWSSMKQLNDFTSQTFQGNNLSDDLDDDAAWLLKILITNFPALPNETIKDIDYNDRCLYSLDELNEFKDYLIECKSKIPDWDELSQGTMFFIKLGEGKHQLLEDAEEKFFDRIQNSIYFLKSLKNINVNGSRIDESPNLEFHKHTIETDDPDFKEIAFEEDRDKLYPIKFQYGYNKELKEDNGIIGNTNFYKYFPIEDDCTSLSFIFHCNVFNIETNRRKGHDSEISQKLFSLISKYMIKDLDKFQKSDFNTYTNIFANILFSNPADGDNTWENKYLYDKLHDYSLNNVPTQGKSFLPSQFTKIKGTTLPILLSDVGLENYDWFYWTKDDNKEVVSVSKKSKKTNLEKWSLIDIVDNTNDIDKVNAWVKRNSTSYLSTIQEELIEENWSDIKNIVDLKFISFDQELLSIRQIINDDNYILLRNDSKNLAPILEKCGVKVASIFFDDSMSCFTTIKHHFNHLENDKVYFGNLKAIIENAPQNLTITDKLEVIKNLKLLSNIGSQAIGSLVIFKNRNGNFSSLDSLIDNNNKSDNWSRSISISNEELNATTQSYLVKKENQYEEIYKKYWSKMITDFDKSEILNLYDSLLDVYDRSTNKSDISQLPIIFTTSNTFVKPEQVVFDPSLAFKDKSSYQLFEGLISSNDYQIPKYKTLSYLQKSLFQRQDYRTLTSVISDIGEITLSYDQLETVVVAYSNNGNSIFSHFVFQKDSSSYKLSVRDKLKQQYFSEYQSIQNLVQNTSSNLILLPETFNHYNRAKELLKNTELFNYLIQNKSGEIDLSLWAPALLDEGSKGPTLQTLKAIQSLTIDFDDLKVGENLINLVKSIDLSEEEIEKLSNKISLNVNSNLIQLKEVTSSNIFQGISISDLGIEKDEVSTLVEEYVNNLITLAVSDRDLIRQLFRIGQESDWLHIYEQIPETKISNKSILSFLIKGENLGENIDWGAWDILANDGTYRKVNEGFYSEPLEFLESKYILHSSLNSQQFISSTYILDTPKISSKGIEIFSVEHIQEYSEESVTSFLEFLYENYQKEYGDVNIQNIAESQKEILEKVFGCLPSQYSFSDFALPVELIPEFIQEWIGSNKSKIEFLCTLGFRSDNNLLSKIREAILNDDEIDELVDLSDFSDDDIMNTLIWIKEQNIKLESDSQLEIVQILFENIEPTDNSPFMYVDEITEEEIILQLLDNQEEDILYDSEGYDHQITLAFFQYCLQNNKPLIDLNYYPKNWKDAFNEAIPDIDSNYNITKLEEEISDEVDPIVELLNSDNEVTYNIIPIINKIPLDYTVEETIFFTQKVDSILLDTESERIFISQDSIKDIDSLLEEELKAFDSNTEEYEIISLLIEKSKNIINKIFREGYALLKEQNHVTRSQTVGDNSIIESGDAHLMFGDFETNYRASYAEEAKAQVKEYLKEKGYDVSNWISNYSTVNGVTLNGKDIPLVVKSAKSGMIYFTPNDWKNLQNNSNAQLYIVGRGNKIKNITLKDLEDDHSTFYMKFDLNNLSAVGIGAFASFFKYLPFDTKFVFNDIQGNGSDIMKYFGLNARIKADEEVTPQLRTLKD